MGDYSAVIDAIDRLTVAVNTPSNSFVADCLSTILATVGSVVAVLIFEFIKNTILTPRDEFRKLQRRVNSTLAMYTCYYSNPYRFDKNMNCREKEEYSSASTTVRGLAVEVIAFADAIRYKHCCGVAAEDIKAAGYSLIGLSNSFFSTGDCSDVDNTKELEKEARRLLRIEK